MKNKLIWTIIIVLIALGIIVFTIRTSNPADTAPILNSQGLSSSTLANLGNGATASTSASATGNNPGLTQGATTTPSAASEQTAEFEFACDGKKILQATIYIGGKDPRADLLLIDNSQIVEGQQNESRRLILKQRVADTKTGVKYATDQDTIIFSSQGTTAQIVENGRILFRNCKQTSPAVR